MNEPKTIITDWDKVPNGLILVRAFHERVGHHVYHVELKTDANQPCCALLPRVPIYTSEATKDSHKTFWNWAMENLPVYDYPTPIKAA